VAANPLLVRFAFLLEEEELEGPVLDLACGRGDNGLYLAGLGLPVVFADRSGEALDEARASAAERHLQERFWEVDLETGDNPLPKEHYRAILVFRYLHRPLIPHVRNAIRPGGVLIYETFTVEQPKYGKPHNPDYLLQPGELVGWFRDWEVIHYFEGILENPMRAMAQIVCRKPPRPSASSLPGDEA
jgi:tellurite methyltransferase